MEGKFENQRIFFEISCRNLRIYLKDGSYQDIDPIADRLLVFQSRMLEHEVLPAHATRFAITMWFY